MYTRLFTVKNYKTVKGEAHGYRTLILHLAPADEAEDSDHKRVNLCPKSTPQCRYDCLYYAGRGIMPTIQQARIRRTHAYLENRVEFTLQLIAEVERYHALATRDGMRLAVRINGTSDQPALARAVARRSPKGTIFYDYTKIYGAWHYSGIHYTFSRSEENEFECHGALRDGINVAVVFNTPKDQPLPARYTIWRREYDVIDGDQDDLRFLDPQEPTGVIIGLRAKGFPAKQDTSGGFVVSA